MSNSRTLTPGRKPGIHATPLDAPCPACTGTGRLHSCADFPVPTGAGDRVTAVLAAVFPGTVGMNPDAADRPDTGTPAEVLRFIGAELRFAWTLHTFRVHSGRTGKVHHVTQWVGEYVRPVSAPPSIGAEYVPPVPPVHLPLWAVRPDTPNGRCEVRRVILPGVGAVPVPVLHTPHTTPEIRGEADVWARDVRRMRERLARPLTVHATADGQGGRSVVKRLADRREFTRQPLEFERSSGVGAVPVPRTRPDVIDRATMPHPATLTPGVVTRRSLTGSRRFGPMPTGSTRETRRPVKQRRNVWRSQTNATTGRRELVKR